MLDVVSLFDKYPHSKPDHQHGCTLIFYCLFFFYWFADANGSLISRCGLQCRVKRENCRYSKLDHESSSIKKKNEPTNAGHTHSVFKRTQQHHTLYVRCQQKSQPNWRHQPNNSQCTICCTKNEEAKKKQTKKKWSFLQNQMKRIPLKRRNTYAMSAEHTRLHMWIEHKTVCYYLKKKLTDNSVSKPDSSPTI